MSRLRLAFAALLLAPLAPLVGPATPAVAASGACPTSSGVTVVVSFGSLGGGTVVRCARTSGSGLDALHAAGFSTEGTRRDGAAFVCRLAGKPDASAEGCGSTPPIDKSWRYWYAGNGGSWKYSSSGAASRIVVQGGFEGWSFGGGSMPGASPIRATSSGSSSSAGGSEGNPGAAPTGPSSAEGSALPKPAPRAGSSASPEPSVVPSTPGQTTPSASAAESGGGAGPWIAGVLIIALAIAAIVTQRRRSRTRTSGIG